MLPVVGSVLADNTSIAVPGKRRGGRRKPRLRCLKVMDGGTFPQMSNWRQGLAWLKHEYTLFSPSSAYHKKVRQEVAFTNIQRIWIVTPAIAFVVCIYILNNFLDYPYAFPRPLVLFLQILIIVICLFFYVLTWNWKKKYGLPLFGSESLRSANGMARAFKAASRFRIWNRVFWSLIIILLDASWIVASVAREEFIAPIAVFVLIAVVPLSEPKETLLYLILLNFMSAGHIFLGLAPANEILLSMALYSVFLVIISLMMFRAYCSHVIVRLELEKANMLIRKISMTDSLTGLYNRRALHALITKRFLRSVNAPLDLAAIMLDIDFFKDFNDAFGHVAGDVCIKKIAGGLRASFPRSSALMARLGGEEFIVILKDEQPEAIRGYVRTLQEKIHALAIPAGRTQVSPYVTVSLGLLLPSPLKDFRWNRGYRLVDNALYQAKKQGRNRMVEVAYDAPIDHTTL